jgi:phage tail-like protein
MCAQQPSPAARPEERPFRVVKVKTEYPEYRYRLGVGTTPGKYLAGFSRMAITLDGAKASPQRPGADQTQAGPKYDAITLERGAAHDNSFGQWADRRQQRRVLPDLVLDVFNETGQKSASHKLTGCVVSEYAGGPNLDGRANEVSIESLELRCRGVR